MTTTDVPAAVLSPTTTTRLAIPRAGTLEFTRDRATGAILSIDGGGRNYLVVEPGGVWRWADLCATSEETDGELLVRHVDTPYGQWVEHYRWHGDALTEVDGVTIRRDEHSRVVACLPAPARSGGSDPAPADHRWLYTYDGPGATHIAGPFGTRSIATTADGIVRSSRQDGITQRYRYDGRGCRVAPHRPSGDHVDDAGRCWASVDETGTVRHVFIWDGSRCLARIDGIVGDPLAAVFSLDPSATPVRIVTPGGCVRIPRDAYGEGLLAHRGVPGLFSGQIHAGLVHLPLRRLDPRTASFCDPDPCAGDADDPRRLGAFEGPLPVEPAPRSPYEVCRGDPVGRADPSGGVSAGLIISTLTWSFQNNILAFFGIDWWFNLFASLLVAPFKNVPSTPIEYDFFSSTGLSASPRHGGFGLRRGGIIDAITNGRAFTTQHIVWAPDSEFAELERGEVIDPGGELTPTHYGSILAITPSGRPRQLLQSMRLAGLAAAGVEDPAAAWVVVVAGSLDSWSRHGGRGVAVAPGALTPWFPSGGLHLDTTLDTRHDIGCDVAELVPGAVGLGDLEDRSFLTAPSATGLAAGDRVVVSDGTNLAIASVVAVVAAGTTERVQLDTDLDGLGTTALDMTEIAATAASTESRGAGAVANSIDVHGTAATYAANDLLRLTAAGGEVTVARVERLEAQVPLDRPLPAGFGGPIAVATGTVAPSGPTVTVAGANLDFGTATRPGVGATGLVRGGGSDVAVRIESHAGTSEAAIDVTLPAAITGAASITFLPVTAGTVLGTRAEAAEPEPRVTYTPSAAGTAPDGSTGTVVVQCSAGGIDHARVVTGVPAHDVAALDRAIAGAAPFDTERFPSVAGASPVTGLTRADVVALVVPDPDRFASAPAAFLTKVAGDPPTPVAPPVLAAVDVAAGVVATTQPAATPIPRLEPGRPVLAGGRAAVIRTVRVTATFDRPYDLAADGLRAVGLVATGDAYLAAVTGADEIVVEPFVNVAGTTVEVPFPRFLAGDLVRITDRTGANPTWHRVTGAGGSVLRLVDGPALTPGDALVRHVATTDPATGGPFLAIDGTRSGTGPTATATFSVWSAQTLQVGTTVGIIDGGVTHPTTVAAGATGTQDIELTFSEEFDATAVDVATLTRVDDAFVTTLARDGGVLLLEGPAGGLVTATGESLVAVAYTGNGVTQAGTLGPGTLLVPEGEDTEVDRSQSLVDHELQHTLQYAKWGPLWFNIFPMLAMELPGILATDTELPEYSRFLDGTVEVGTGSRWNLTIADTGGVSIGADDELQVIQGARRAKVKVAAVNGSVFEVRATGSGGPPTGNVSVRKQQNASVFDGFFAFFDLLTHGGLVNLLAGSTWGGIFWLIGKGFYGLGRAIGGTGELYPATVQDGGGVLTLSNDAGQENIRAEGRIVVRQGDNTVVRAMTRSGAIVTLTQGVSFTGDVQVAMYDTHDPGSAFDWYDYHPATIADAANPAVIELGAVDGDTLSLGPEDRVEIKYRAESFKTDVIAVTGSTVELLQPINIVDGELSVRIAKVGTSDPLGNADSAAMVEMGMGWMKWLFDPYGQIEYAAAPREEWAHWLLRVMRWLLGTQNFSLLPFGYLWWSRLFPIEPEHITVIEQEASEESGDLYSPLGRLLGQRTGDGFARARMEVGDVARYRYWPNGRTLSFVNRGQLDAPGVNYTTQLRTMPNRVDTGAGTNPPNVNVEVGPTADPGTFVAAPFTVRDTDPRVIPPAPGAAVADPLGFRTADLGQVPVSARTQRMQSTYVAFTRAGNHRMTTVNNIESAANAQRAVDADDAERQTLFIDVGADDVTVTVAGQAVAHGDTVTMVPLQRAAVTVTPNTSRTYRTSVVRPAGPVLQIDGSGRLAAAGVGAGEAVEVSRFYAPDGSGNYGPGGLAFAGMHLSRELHIPVRRFAVDVVATLPLRDAADPAAAELTSLAVGADGFILVPAPITVPPRVTSIAGNPPAAGDPNPVEQFASPAAAALLGTAGAAFRVRFPAGSTTGDVVITVTVGDGTATADLTTTFTLTG
ncbi:MAG: hypothetical protein ACRD0G_05330 [Acidimicrobiales bacterium]